MEQKKIKVKKVNSAGGNVSHSNSDKGKQDSLKILENTVKRLTNRFNQYGFNDSKEEDFLNENKGKKITVELQDKELEGILESIDKYRIGLIIDDRLYYYYKHAIVGYYVK